MDEDSADLIENYKIEATLYASLEGSLHWAVDTQSGNRVLLKKYYPSLRWSEEILNEFFNLISYLRFIEYDYLQPIVDVGKYDGRPYVVFDGEARDLLKDVGQLHAKEILRFMRQIAEALDFLHKQEIIHGCLSPENILLDRDGNPRIFDYGLHGVFKKLLLENMDEGFENLSVSNLRCTAPEQILGRSPNRASDIYSFGIMGYFYIYGEFPVGGQYVPEIALSHFGHEVPKALELPEGISNNTLQFIQKCIQVNPEARFASFSQFLESLARMQSGKKVRLKFDKRFAVRRPPLRIRSSPAFMGLTVLLLGLFAFYAAQNGRIPNPSALAGTSTVLANALLLEKSATPTERPVVATPTESGSSSATVTVTPTEVGPTYWLAFEGQEPVDADQPISFDNLDQLREISRLGFGKPEEAAASADNNHFAIATSAGVAIFEGDEFLKWLDAQGWATSVEFSPDGETLAIGLTTGEIQLWDWQGGIKSAQLEGEWHHTKKINRILFSRGGYLYTASDDQQVIIWDLRSNKSIRGLTVHSQPVNDIALTSDGRTLVTCADDKLIRVWDLASGQKLYELSSNAQFFTGAIRALAISSDDAYFAAGGESGYLYQWNLLTSPSVTDPLPRPRADTAPVAQKIWSLQYIRDDSEILVGVDDGQSVIYEAARKEYEGISLTFEILPRSLRLVDAFGPGFEFDSFTTFYNDGILSLNWDGLITSQDTSLSQPRYDILDRLDFSMDGTILAAGGRRGSTQVWNLTSNESIYEGFYALSPGQPIYEGIHSLPLGDPISPDGTSIALVMPKIIRTSDNALTTAFYQIRNFSGAGPIKELTQTLDDANVGYASNGSIFIASNLKESRAWDYATGNETNLSGYAYTGCWVTASASDLRERLLVNSAAGIFPPADDDQVNSLCPKTYQFRGSLSAVSHDLGLMVFLNSNGWLEGYDVLAKTPPWPPFPLETLSTTLAISPDGSVVAVGNTSGRILFINGKTGQLLDEIVGNFGEVDAIEFSDDGKRLATAGEDGVVRIFGITNAE